MRVKYPVVLIALLLLIASGGFVGFQLLDRRAHAESKDWPAFTMVYRDESPFYTTDRTLGWSKIEFVYNGPTNWKVTTLDTHEDLGARGSWSRYDGKTISHYDARTGEQGVNDVSKDNGIYLADQWLAPSYIASLLQNPNAEKQLGDSPETERVVITEEVPCPPSPEEQANETACTLTVTDEVIYTIEHQIPMKMITKQNNVMVRTITVEELTLH